MLIPTSHVLSLWTGQSSTVQQLRFVYSVVGLALLRIMFNPPTDKTIGNKQVDQMAR